MSSPRRTTTFDTSLVPSTVRRRPDCPQSTRISSSFRPSTLGEMGEGRVRSVNGEPWALRDSSLTLVVSLLSLTWGAPLAVGLILGEQRPSVDAGESECCVGGDKDGCCYSARQNTTSLHSLFFKGNKEEVERSLDATNWEKRRGGAKWSCAVRVKPTFFVFVAKRF